MMRIATNLAGALILAWAAFASTAEAQEAPSYGPELQGFDYPWPVQHFRFASQGVDLDMAYMDVKPTKPNNEVAVLLHGKNFCAATWRETIKVLSDAGYRVIAPDQIGFCKSSKPERYQFSFQQLAANTHALLASLGVSHATLIGHSTGGMLAIRYGLMYPTDLNQLVLVDPDRSRGLEGQGSSLAERRRLASARIAHERREHPGLRARDLLCGLLEPELRTMGADACRDVPRPGQGDRRLGFGASLRHDLHAAGRL